MTRLLAGAALAAALACPSAARACGGFFCNVSQPVDQAGEDILFAVDKEAGTVTMHVAIQYEGPADEFAWVLPVPGEPDLQIGTDALFPVLGRLRAQFVLNRAFEEGCAVPVAAPSSADTDGAGGGGVSVVSRGVVGPYETVVLTAEDSGELLDWLQTNGFDLPDDLEPLLGAYVAEGQHFVALRLAKDKDAGDLEPLSLTWEGDAIAIPIQLTSVAATPDMRLRVYVLGDDRAVPDSYFHLAINELAVDWWTGGANLEEVITRAADEAGGHGFFTDYSGTPEPVRGQLYSTAWDDLPTSLATLSGPGEAVLSILNRRIPLDDAMMGLLSDQIGIPATATDGLDLLDLLQCLSPYGSGYYGGYYGGGDPEDCYFEELAALPFDPVALGDAVEAEFLEPRRRADALLAKHRQITRMTSSVSPHEMTVDPTFVFNPTMPDVALQRTATETFLCGTSSDLAEVDRELALPDGRKVVLPSLNDLATKGLTSIQWLEQQALTEPTNAWIERTSADGDPEIVTDNREYLASQVEDLHGHGVKVFRDGCGCGSGAGSGTGTGAAGVLGALAIAVARRRRP